MKILICLIPVIGLLALGCHKNDNQPSVQQQPEQAQAAEAPEQAAPDPSQPPPPPPPIIAATAENVVHNNVTGEVNPFLTQQLRVFIQQSGRMPQSFTEFAHLRLDSIPRPPEGMKWIIDAATQEVKSVPR